MNMQDGKIIKDENGRIIKLEGGIEWTATFIHERTNVIWGRTWNPVAGCQHACRWNMPDGKIAECYAETTAEGVAAPSYPHGFEHHYWNSPRLVEPLSNRTSMKIFTVSMGDLFGSWVPADQINLVMDVVRAAPWHTFIFLTKNAPRLLKFSPFPDNAWVGVSMPPDSFRRKTLTQAQKSRMFANQMKVLSQISARVKFCSFEPISWNVGKEFRDEISVLNWAIMGAASTGRIYHQPARKNADGLLDVLDMHGIPTFYKGNYQAPLSEWRMNFPFFGD